MAHPKYDKRNVTQASRPKGPTRRSLTSLRAPTNTGPTRLVLTSLDGVKNGGAQVTHWPSGGKEGTDLQWVCPECGRIFIRDEVGASWRLN